MKNKKKTFMTLLLTGSMVLGTVGIASANMPNSNMYNNGNNGFMQNAGNMQQQFSNNRGGQGNMGNSAQMGMGQNSPQVNLNGQQLSFDVQPQVENGTTMVPLRTILEALGAEISWDEATQTVTITKDGTTIELTVNQDTAYQNGKAIKMNASSQIINGQTMVPLRFISESFGANVNWDEASQCISILTGENGYNVSDNSTIGDLKETLNDEFEDAGESYFDDDGITTAIGLTGNGSKLVYTVKLDFSDADDYDTLADLSESDIESFLDAVEETISDELSDTDYEDADITGRLIGNDNYGYYVSYDGSDYTFSWNEFSISNLKTTLNDEFADAGEDYFADDGITVAIGLTGNESKLVYTVKLDFSDADDYDKLSELDESDIETFLTAVEAEIIDEIDGTDYEDADITGKLVDNDRSSYYVTYDGSDYTYSWD